MYVKKLNITFLFILMIYVGAGSQTIEEVPRITNVSIDKTSQQVVLTWALDDPTQVDGYYIFRQIFGHTGIIDGSYIEIDTIRNPNQFIYIDESTDPRPANPGNGIETYRVAAFKQVVGGIDNIIMSEPVSTIHLSPIDYDYCQNTLNWTTYDGFGDDLTGYNIYYSNSLEETLTLLEQVSTDQNSYIHEGINSNTQYYYYIEASNNTGLSSFSNRQALMTSSPPVPQTINADYATVNTPGQVDLSFTLDPDVDINEYLLLKTNSSFSQFDTLASYPSGTSTIQYTDEIETNKSVAFYCVQTINACDKPTIRSNYSSNILLEASKEGHISHLGWSKYSNWKGRVENYSIYRSIDGSIFEEIATLNEGELNYQDDVSELIQPGINSQANEGRFCYYIQATEGTSNPYGIIGKSKSNEVCIEYEPIVYLPNAFNPNSIHKENRTFKPVASFTQNYELIIYNRWGGIQFQTKNPMQGWDGRGKGGELMPKGTYVFYLKYQKKDGETVTRSGQINLVY